MADPVQILLVEDDPIQRFLTALLLERAGGFEVLTAADGLEALELALQERPQVILLDLILPSVSGLEFLRRYRQGGGRAGVLALSRCAGEKISAGALAAGADFFLSKPASWSEIYQNILLLSGGLTRRCEELLLSLGASSRWSGVRQAARCAALLGESGREKPLMKEVYLQTAREERTTPVCVEKNIRALADDLYQTDAAAFCQALGLPPGRPANRSFLLALAQAGSSFGAC